MLVSVEEQIRYMSGVNFTTQQRIEAESTLNGVQSELETYLNRPLELTQVREVVRTDSQGYANLSISPVWKIVKTDSIEASYAPFDLNPYIPYIPSPMERDPLIDETTGRPLEDWLPTPNVGNPLIVPGGLYTGLPNSWYVVEYVAGWNGYGEEGLKQDIKRVAARELTRQHDDTLSLRGDRAEAGQEADPREKGWTDAEKKKWDRLRRRVIA